MSVLNQLKRRLSWAGLSNRTKSRSTPVFLRVEPLEVRAVLDGVPTPPIFQNPFMAPNNFSEIHLNAYQTDTTSQIGPASAPSQTVEQGLINALPAIAGTMTFNSSGQIITVRTGPSTTPGEEANTLLLIDPVSLTVLAEEDLPPRTSSSGVSFSGGGYFYLDDLDRVVAITTTQEIRLYEVRANQFALTVSYQLSSYINNPDDILNSVLPDSAGNLWFITQLGGVGYVTPASGTIHFANLRDVPGADPMETNTKSFASDEHGAVYVVSDFALYRFEAGPQGPQNIWRSAYDRGTRVKPGQNQQGSGTTPTLFNDFDGNQFVAIADNSDPFMHVNVYDQETGALVAQQAVFSAFANRNACENSLIAVNHSIIIENNYGNATVLSTFGPLTTVPGVDRVDFDPTTGESSVVWENTTVAIPSVVSQLSTGDGFVYTYAKDATGWYFGALDFYMGSLVAQSRVPLSDVLGGLLANNYYSGLGIGPDGSAYVGVFGGVVAWRPGPAGGGGEAGQVAEVRAFDAATKALNRDFFPIGSFAGSVRVTVGNVLGDGVPSLVIGAGPKARVFSDARLSPETGYDPQTAPFLGNTRDSWQGPFRPASFRQVRVAAVDGNGDNRADLVRGAWLTGGAVLVLDPLALQQLDSFFASLPFEPSFQGGVLVGAG